MHITPNVLFKFSISSLPSTFLNIKKKKEKKKEKKIS